MNPIRAEVVGFISEQPKPWRELVEKTYALVLKDCIGQYGLDKRDGIPGIWGHSYVRTYYRWIGKTPPDSAAMEGGIATSYYVAAALSNWIKRTQSTLPREIVEDLASFFKTRTKASGIGVKTMTLRGQERVAVNLRHTCFGMLTIDRLKNLPGFPDCYSETCKASAVIVSSHPKADLLEAWLSESWPIGGIASYIRARDQIVKSDWGRNWVEGEGRVWPGVRVRLLRALAELRSADIEYLSSATSSGEHYPYWHPINSLPILQLHSTLGVLSLLGRDLAKLNTGRDRIEQIVSNLRQQILDSNDKLPRFAPGSRPSLCAAITILSVVLGKWREPVPRDRELLRYMQKFLVENVGEPSVYEEYWSEFSAPLLELDEIHLGLEKCIGEVRDFAALTAGRLAITPSQRRACWAIDDRGTQDEILSLLAQNALFT